jgi:hypothetical protein
MQGIKSNITMIKDLVAALLCHLSLNKGIKGNITKIKDLVAALLCHLSLNIVKKRICDQLSLVRPKEQDSYNGMAHE